MTAPLKYSLTIPLWCFLALILSCNWALALSHSDTRVLNPNSEGSEAGVESARFPDQSSLVNGHIPSQPPMADLQQPTIPYENMAESPPLSRASEASSRREARAAELAEYHDPASSSHAAPPQQTSYSQRAQELAAKDGLVEMQHQVVVRGIAVLGAACVLDSECVSGSCSYLERKCQCRPCPEIGCATRDGCSDKSYCHHRIMQANICSGNKVPGDACNQHYDCASGECHKLTGKCACKPCDIPGCGGCRDGSRCLSKPFSIDPPQCTGTLAIGSDCTRDIECVSGKCTLGKCECSACDYVGCGGCLEGMCLKRLLGLGTNYCTKGAQMGQDCTYDSDCVTGNCAGLLDRRCKCRECNEPGCGGCPRGSRCIDKWWAKATCSGDVVLNGDCDEDAECNSMNCYKPLLGRNRCQCSKCRGPVMGLTLDFEGCGGCWQGMRCWRKWIGQNFCCTPDSLLSLPPMNGDCPTDAPRRTTGRRRTASTVDVPRDPPYQALHEEGLADGLPTANNQRVHPEDVDWDHIEYLEYYLNNPEEADEETLRTLQPYLDIPDRHNLPIPGQAIRRKHMHEQV